jgi:hypothetical protein
MKQTILLNTRNSPPFRQQLRLTMMMAIAMVLIMSWIGVKAQSRQVSGRVISEANSELPGVNILVKGTSTGTATSADGKYTINVTDDNAVLVFSFIGYTSEEVVVGNRISIDVQQLPDIKALSEVVWWAMVRRRKVM